MSVGDDDRMPGGRRDGTDAVMLRVSKVVTDSRVLYIQPPGLPAAYVSRMSSRGRSIDPSSHRLEVVRSEMWGGVYAGRRYV